MRALALPVTPSGLLHPGFSIDRLEKELIMESLARSSGNKTEAAKLLGIPASVTQVCLLAVGYYTGDSFTPAPRRPASEVTFLNRWKNPIA